MNNSEAHQELNDILSKYLKARNGANTSKERDQYDKPIEAIRQACKVLRNAADETNVNQTDLFK